MIRNNKKLPENKTGTDGFGFTIVELLIVIVVIGVLAGITLVAYNGVQKRAVVASLKSSLDGSSKQLEMFQVESGLYPETIDCEQPDSSTNKCVNTDSSVEYTYYVNNSASPQQYCITATTNNIVYSKGRNGIVALGGGCPILSLDAGDSISYPGNGTTWNDMSGYGNSANLVNGVSYSNTDGGILNFDGTNDGASVPNLNLPISDSFSVSAWIRFDKYAYMEILGSGTFNFKWRVAGSNPYWNMYGPSGNYIGAISYTYAPSINQWHNFVFTYDGVNRTVYLDGALNRQVPTTGGIRVPTNFSIAPTGGELMSGSMSSIMVHDRALTSTEVLNNYDNTKGRYGL